VNVPGPSSAPTSKLASIRELLSGTLLAYQRAGGITGDAYLASPTFHPMAAGKCLLALLDLHRAGLLSHATLVGRAGPVVAALDRAAVAPPSGVGGKAWGLGFGWRDLPPDEPYLITTAIVTRALALLRQLAPDLSTSSDLADNGLTSLRDWCLDWCTTSEIDRQVVLPAYSRGLRLPVFNAAAMAWAVLGEFDPNSQAAASAALYSIWECRVAGLGWQYEPGSPVVDLVHQSYLYKSMMSVVPVQTVSQDLETSIGQFVGATDWIDAIHLVGGSTDTARYATWKRLHGGYRLSIEPRPARLWSLGELLTLVSAIAATEGSRGPWLQRASAIAGLVQARLLTQQGEALWARHSMHAAHGLAAYLLLRRTQGSADRLVV
jgi:hypothetical protein